MTSSRIACVNVHALPLQLALREHPDWRNDPVVIVADDKPQALILFANARARAVKIEPGLRFMSAQALSSCLHASVLSPSMTARAVSELTESLRAFSPHVEATVDGSFFLDASGLTPLFSALQAWSAKVLARVQGAGFNAGLVVGFSRDRVAALARMQRGALLLRSVAQEEQLVHAVPLRELALSEVLARDLRRLGVTTVGDLLALDPSELRSRYGRDAAHLHERLRGEGFRPLMPTEAIEVLAVHTELDGASDDLQRLAFIMKGLLHELMDKLTERCSALVALQIELELDGAPPHTERIVTAKPTLDAVQVLSLARLRLDAHKLTAKVTALTLTAESQQVHPEQLLLLGRPKRDLEAAGRALAQLRAAFGEESVSVAALASRHLPEASFTWTIAVDVPEPRPVLEATEPPLVRQLFSPAQALTTPPTHATLALYGDVLVQQGPHRTSGGWWKREVERDYYFLETRRGDVLWAYYDKLRQQWFLQGVID